MTNTVKAITTAAGGPKETLLERGATMVAKSVINKVAKEALKFEPEVKTDKFKGA